MENYYLELPSNFEKDYEIDAKHKKTAIVLNGIAFLVVLAMVLPVIILSFNNIEEENPIYGLIAIFSLMVGIIVYMILHELVHGIAYKALTKQKLKFGLTLSVAYCGVPDIYVSKKTALIALLSPFILFTVIFVPFMILLRDYHLVSLVIYMIFSMHVSGCVGDIYCTIILIFKYHKRNVLVKDTGPVQTFFVEK